MKGKDGNFPFLSFVALIPMDSDIYLEQSLPHSTPTSKSGNLTVRFSNICGTFLLTQQAQYVVRDNGP